LKAKTLGALKKSAYQPCSVKEELRRNLIERMKHKQPSFDGIHGFDHTVIPSLERAILAKHNINLLGLRGQAKTRIARAMVNLLDEFIPVIAGSEVNDDPFQPISYYGKQLLAEMGDDLPIEWVGRNERYTEKLATPDVTVADLIGDIDPIKAANNKFNYADEQVIHFGLIPRANRGIFVINELPDLQPRIQVALFNILQESDMQIRGFKLRFPIDAQFIFTANPEDYTNRGAIITPLKDRIQSQIITHYPRELEVALAITKQEVKLSPEQVESIVVPEPAETLIEQVAIEARKSEYVDEKSGVSARLSISAYEAMMGSAERRLHQNAAKQEIVRVSDFTAIVPAIVGKIEMVYEGEQEGAVNVSQQLITAAIRTIAAKYFHQIDEVKTTDAGKAKTPEAYIKIVEWFRAGNAIDLMNDDNTKTYRQKLEAVPGLEQHIQSRFPKMQKEARYFMMEFLLHGLAAYSLLDKQMLDLSYTFQDLFSAYFPQENRPS
jgi:magnesium chelatase subunit I